MAENHEVAEQASTRDSGETSHQAVLQRSPRFRAKMAPKLRAAAPREPPGSIAGDRSQQRLESRRLGLGFAPIRGRPVGTRHRRRRPGEAPCPFRQWLTIGQTRRSEQLGGGSFIQPLGGESAGEQVVIASRGRLPPCGKAPPDPFAAGVVRRWTDGISARATLIDRAGAAGDVAKLNRRKHSHAYVIFNR